MNDSILPDAVRPGRHYSFRADLALNAWAFMAVGVAFLTRWLLQHHLDWGLWLRSAIALTPLIPSVFYVKSIAGWMRRLDELQRRIQLEACLIATTGTVFIGTALGLLQGVANLQSPRLQHGLGWEGTFAAIIGLYFVANVIINRRYR